jgi:pimeloyl-ACP methyl ester carboxylesterase
VPDSAPPPDADDLYAQSIELQTPHGSIIAYPRIESAMSTRARCLLLHGNPGSLTHFAHLSSLLAQHVNLAALDLPGYGRSPSPSRGPKRLGLEASADAVIDAADALGFHGRVVLIGHSHGGGVAQITAARHGERVSAIVPIASLGAPAHRGYRLLALPGASTVASLFARALRIPALRPPLRRVASLTARRLFKLESMSLAQVEREFATVVARGELLSNMVEAAADDPCGLLLRSAPAIHCPALFLHGDRDTLVPARYARTIHDAIVASGGRSRFRVIEGAGHMLIEQHAKQLATLVMEFIQSLPRDE